MNFDFPMIFVGLVFSSIGFIYFSYGKRLQRFQLMICGLTMMVYPYFVDKIVTAAIVGAVLAILPFLLKWW